MRKVLGRQTYAHAARCRGGGLVHGAWAADRLRPAGYFFVCPLNSLLRFMPVFCFRSLVEVKSDIRLLLKIWARRFSLAVTCSPSLIQVIVRITLLF
jgi:hypothetical protein